MSQGRNDGNRPAISPPHDIPSSHDGSVLVDEDLSYDIPSDDDLFSSSVLSHTEDFSRVYDIVIDRYNNESIQYPQLRRVFYIFPIPAVVISSNPDQVPAFVGYNPDCPWSDLAKSQVYRHRIQHEVTKAIQGRSTSILTAGQWFLHHSVNPNLAGLTTTSRVLLKFSPSLETIHIYSKHNQERAVREPSALHLPLHPEASSILTGAPTLQARPNTPIHPASAHPSLAPQSMLGQPSDLSGRGMDPTQELQLVRSLPSALLLGVAFGIHHVNEHPNIRPHRDMQLHRGFLHPDTQLTQPYVPFCLTLTFRRNGVYYLQAPNLVTCILWAICLHAIKKKWSLPSAISKFCHIDQYLYHPSDKLSSMQKVTHLFDAFPTAGRTTTRNRSVWVQMMLRSVRIPEVQSMLNDYEQVVVSMLEHEEKGDHPDGTPTASECADDRTIQNRPHHHENPLSDTQITGVTTNMQAVSSPSTSSHGPSNKQHQRTKQRYDSVNYDSTVSTDMVQDSLVTENCHRGVPTADVLLTCLTNDACTDSALESDFSCKCSCLHPHTVSPKHPVKNLELLESCEALKTVFQFIAEHGLCKALKSKKLTVKQILHWSKYHNCLYYLPQTERICQLTASLSPTFFHTCLQQWKNIVHYRILVTGQYFGHFVSPSAPPTLIFIRATPNLQSIIYAHDNIATIRTSVSLRHVQNIVIDHESPLYLKTKFPITIYFQNGDEPNQSQHDGLLQNAGDTTPSAASRLPPPFTRNQSNMTAAAAVVSLETSNSFEQPRQLAIHLGAVNYETYILFYNALQCALQYNRQIAQSEHGPEHKHNITDTNQETSREQMENEMPAKPLDTVGNLWYIRRPESSHHSGSISSQIRSQYPSSTGFSSHIDNNLIQHEIAVLQPFIPVNILNIIRSELSNTTRTFAELFIIAHILGTSSDGQLIYYSVYRPLGYPLALRPSTTLSNQSKSLQIWLTCNHPNIIQYLGTIKSPTTGSFVVMEFAQFRSVHAILLRAAEPLREASIAYIAYSVLQALAYLHSRDIIHRDIKADNIVVNQLGCVKVSDLSVCLQLSSSHTDALHHDHNDHGEMSNSPLNDGASPYNGSAQQLGDQITSGDDLYHTSPYLSLHRRTSTRSHSTITSPSVKSDTDYEISRPTSSASEYTEPEPLLAGSPLWFSPEVILGNQLSPKTDIYSLGITLLEIAQGGTVPNDHLKSLSELADCILLQPSPELPPDIAARYSSLMLEFISLCLVKDPQHRLSAQELLQHPWLEQLKLQLGDSFFHETTYRGDQLAHKSARQAIPDENDTSGTERRHQLIGESTQETILREMVAAYPSEVRDFITYCRCGSYVELTLDAFVQSLTGQLHSYGLDFLYEYQSSLTPAFSSASTIGMSAISSMHLDSPLEAYDEHQGPFDQAICAQPLSQYNRRRASSRPSRLATTFLNRLDLDDCPSPEKLPYSPSLDPLDPFAGDIPTSMVQPRMTSIVPPIKAPDMHVFSPPLVRKYPSLSYDHPGSPGMAILLGSAAQWEPTLDVYRPELFSLKWTPAPHPLTISTQPAYLPSSTTPFPRADFFVVGAFQVDLPHMDAPTQQRVGDMVHAGKPTPLPGDILSLPRSPLQYPPDGPELTSQEYAFLVGAGTHSSTLPFRDYLLAVSANILASLPTCDYNDYLGKLVQIAESQGFHSYIDDSTLDVCCIDLEQSFQGFHESSVFWRYPSPVLRISYTQFVYSAQSHHLPNLFQYRDSNVPLKNSSNRKGVQANIGLRHQLPADGVKFPESWQTSGHNHVYTSDAEHGNPLSSTSPAVATSFSSQSSSTGGAGSLQEKDTIRTPLSPDLPMNFSRSIPSRSPSRPIYFTYRDALTSMNEITVQPVSRHRSGFLELYDYQDLDAPPSPGVESLGLSLFSLPTQSGASDIHEDYPTAGDVPNLHDGTHTLNLIGLYLPPINLTGLSFEEDGQWLTPSQTAGTAVAFPSHHCVRVADHHSVDGGTIDPLHQPDVVHETAQITRNVISVTTTTKGNSPHHTNAGNNATDGIADGIATVSSANDDTADRVDIRRASISSGIQFSRDSGSTSSQSTRQYSGGGIYDSADQDVKISLLLKKIDIRIQSKTLAPQQTVLDRLQNEYAAIRNGIQFEPGHEQQSIAQITPPSSHISMILTSTPTESTTTSASSTMPASEQSQKHPNREHLLFPSSADEKEDEKEPDILRSDVVPIPDSTLSPPFSLDSGGSAPTGFVPFSHRHQPRMTHQTITNTAVRLTLSGMSGSSSSLAPSSTNVSRQSPSESFKPLLQQLAPVRHSYVFNRQQFDLNSPHGVYGGVYPLMSPLYRSEASMSINLSESGDLQSSISEILPSPGEGFYIGDIAELNGGRRPRSAPESISDDEDVIRHRAYHTRIHPSLLSSFLVLPASSHPNETGLPHSPPPPQSHPWRFQYERKLLHKTQLKTLRMRFNQFLTDVRYNRVLVAQSVQRASIAHGKETVVDDQLLIPSNSGLDASPTLEEDDPLDQQMFHTITQDRRPEVLSRLRSMNPQVISDRLDIMLNADEYGISDSNSQRVTAPPLPEDIIELRSIIQSMRNHANSRPHRHKLMQSMDDQTNLLLRFYRRTTDYLRNPLPSSHIEMIQQNHYTNTGRDVEYPVATETQTWSVQDIDSFNGDQMGWDSSRPSVEALSLINHLPSSSVSMPMLSRHNSETTMEQPPPLPTLLQRQIRFSSEDYPDDFNMNEQTTSTSTDVDLTPSVGLSGVLPDPIPPPLMTHGPHGHRHLPHAHGDYVRSTHAQQFSRGLLRLGCSVGRGCNGPIELAFHLPTLSLVALKTVQMFDTNARHQISRELQAYAKLSSPFTLDLFDVYHDHEEGTLTLATPYMTLGDIKSFVEASGPMNEALLYHISHHCLHALAYLHDNCYLHRDIKPDNVLLHHSGAVKLADFGLLSQLESPTQTVNAYLGTLSYLAPERVHSRAYGLPSDIYALGLTLIYAATGRAVYDTNNYFDIFMKVQHNQQPMIYPHDGFSVQFCNLISCMTKLNPNDRLTARELLAHPFFTSKQQNVMTSPWHAPDQQQHMTPLSTSIQVPHALSSIEQQNSSSCKPQSPDSESQPRTSISSNSDDDEPTCTMVGKNEIGDSAVYCHHCSSMSSYFRNYIQQSKLYQYFANHPLLFYYVLNVFIDYSMRGILRIKASAFSPLFQRNAQSFKTPYNVSTRLAYGPPQQQMDQSDASAILTQAYEAARDDFFYFSGTRPPIVEDYKSLYHIADMFMIPRPATVLAFTLLLRLRSDLPNAMNIFICNMPHFSSDEPVINLIDDNELFNPQPQ